MERPRLKSVFVPLPQGDGIIRIGGYDYGLAAEISDDEQGHVWQLLNLMNGSLTRGEIIQAMCTLDPAVAPDEVEAAMASLIAAGYIEDATSKPPEGLFTPAEMERYRRNFDFFSYFHAPPLTNYDFQARLKQSKVTVLGIGGLGSYVALSLAAAGVGDLLLVDHDHVEASNLNRQVLYTERDLGVLKVDAAARRLAEVNPHVQVKTWNMKVSSVADAQACMSGRDLLICAADRPRIVIYDWINEAAMIERVTWVRGANDGMTVNSFFHVPGETACFECAQTHAREKFAWHERVLDYVKTHVGDRTVNPCISPVAGLIGHLTAFEVMKFLTGVAQPVMYGRKLTVDLQTLETHLGPVVKPHPNCSMCGQYAAVRGESAAWTG